MKYCRFQTDAGPQYGEVVDRAGTLWIKRLLPPFEEDPWTKPGRASHRSLAAYRGEAPRARRALARSSASAETTANMLPSWATKFPKEPLLFLKAPSSVIAPGEPSAIPSQSQRVDFEGELAIVIGKRASHIGPDEDVRPYIRGYTIVNDVTARDLQKSDGQWSRAKGFDTFCPMRPDRHR